MDKKTDRELLELLFEKLTAIEIDVNELKTGQQRIENKLDDIEVHNANRHVSIGCDIKELKSTQLKMEIAKADTGVI